MDELKEKLSEKLALASFFEGFFNLQKTPKCKKWSLGELKNLSPSKSSTYEKDNTNS